MTRRPHAEEHTTETAIAALRALVLTLRPTGLNGFEGLLCEVMSTLTPPGYRLKRSGFQEATDAVAIHQGTRRTLEAKLYRKNASLERHMMATLAYSASALPRPDLVIFAATIEVDADIAARARRFAADSAIELMVLDWHGRMPDLAVLLAADPMPLPRFLRRVRRYPEARQMERLIDTLRANPAFCAARDQLLAELSAATQVFATLCADSIRQNETAMADHTLALRRYGQALCPLGVDADRLITRKATLQQLDEAANTTVPVRKPDQSGTFITQPPILVLGDEGVGKTWLVAQWWLSRHRNKLFLFIPSHLFRGIDLDVERIIRDCLCALLNPDRTSSPETDATWRRRLASDPFQQAAQGSMLIVVDGLNEAPDTDWHTVLEAVWRYTIRLGGLLLLTSRPAFWSRREREMSAAGWPEPATVRVQGFSAEEIARACQLAGRNPNTIPPTLLSQLSNPRVLHLALTLFSQLRRAADLGIDRLLFAYWGQRQRDRADLASIDQDHDVFLRGLAHHAAEFHQRRLEAARSGRHDVESAEVGFEVDDLGKRFRGLERYGRTHPHATEILIGEIREGRFFEDDPLLPASGYLFRKESLAFALGLYLVQDLMRLVRELRTRVTLNTLHERLSVLLEPVLDFDQTADQMMAAVTIACRDPDVTDLVRLVLLEQLLELRNRPPQLKFALSALALEAPAIFCAIAERAIEVRSPDRIDSWLLAALRYMVSAGVGLDTLRSWIVSPAPEELVKCSRLYRTVEDASQARRRETLAARVLAGQNLTPFAEALHDWALLSTATQPFGRPETPPKAFARTAIALLVRCNDADPQLLAAALVNLDLRRGPNIPNDSVARAAAALLALLADPQSLEQAETLYPGIAILIDPPEDLPEPPWYHVYDANTTTSAPVPEPTDPLARPRKSASEPLDPNSPEGESALALAARYNPAGYLDMAQASLHRPFGEGPPLMKLVFRATSALALQPSLDFRFPENNVTILTAFEHATTHRSSNARAHKREHLLEALMAMATESQYEALLTLAAHVLQKTGPLEGEFWHPKLSADLVLRLISMGFPEPPWLLGEDLSKRYEILALLASHDMEQVPKEVLSPLIDCILTTPQPELGPLRSTAFTVASKMNAAELALAIAQQGWTHQSEPDLPLRQSISTLLATQLAGLLPLDQIAPKVSEAPLPAAAERIPDSELPDLSRRIEAALIQNRALNLVPPTPAGARKLLRVSTTWLTDHLRWLQGAYLAMIEGTHPNIDPFIATMLASGQEPIPGAADFLITLLRLTRITRTKESWGILKPALAVAQNEPTRREELLDTLVLSIVDDRVLSELATAARDLGSNARIMLGEYAASLSTSRRSARMAYGFILEALLADPTASDLARITQTRGYLANIQNHARRIQRAHREVFHWAKKRLEEKDYGAEYLALSYPFPYLPWLASTLTLPADADKLDSLFLYRLREATQVEGVNTLFGLSPPPWWVIGARHIMHNVTQARADR